MSDSLGVEEARIAKAVLLAKTAIDSGITLHLLSHPDIRRNLLVATAGPSGKTWSAASNATWTQVRAILAVFG